MKNKALLIVLVSVITIILLTILTVFISGYQFTIARCIVTDNETLYMVYDDRPVHLRYNKDADFQTGDKLFIIHQSAFAESYPEQTKACFVTKLASGSKEDIPQKTFDILIQTKNWNE